MGIDVTAAHVAALRAHGPGWALAYDGTNVRLIRPNAADDGSMLEITTHQNLKDLARILVESGRAEPGPDDERLAAELTSIADGLASTWDDCRRLMPLTVPLTRALFPYKIYRSGMGVVLRFPDGSSSLWQFYRQGPVLQPHLMISATVTGPGEPVFVQVDNSETIFSAHVMLPAAIPHAWTAALIDQLARYESICLPAAGLPAEPRPTPGDGGTATHKSTGQPPGQPGGTP